jgi:hypothetical protein
MLLIYKIINNIFMRSLLCLSLLSAACARLPPKADSATAPGGGCELYVSAGQVVPAFSDTQQAVRDFDNRTGFPYAALYIEKSGGQPDRDKCIRLWQRPDGRFAFYTYTQERPDSAVVRAPYLAVALAHAGQGHFVSLCGKYATEPVSGVLLIKQGRTVAFSLSLDLHEQRNFTGTDKACVDSALHVIRQLTHR